VFQVSYKEGLEEDYMAIVIRSIESTLKDERINESQKIALEDALSYAKHIKNI
jgi:hypothetical protein